MARTTGMEMTTIGDLMLKKPEPEKPSMVPFGERLRQARISRAWSRTRLVNAIASRCKKDFLSLSETSIANIELGRVTPRDTTKVILARVFPELATDPIPGVPGSVAGIYTSLHGISADAVQPHPNPA